MAGVLRTDRHARERVCGPQPDTRVGLVLKVTMKKDYQQRKMEKVLSPQRATITLSAHQRKCIQSVLREE